MSAEGQNLQAKYQKLAAEYAKLRAQNTVLKKAVIEEQEKTKFLQETAKQKDQSIRKFEQEIDSLQFRNDQLSKRVAILQEELDESGSKNWKSWANPAPSRPSVDSDVKEEELKIKIQENERLQRQLSNAKQEHKAIVSSLQERLEAAERKSSTHQKAIDEAADTHRMVVEKLQEDRALMEAKLRRTEEEFRTLSLKAEKSQQRLKLLNNEMSSKYENVSKIIAEKIPFNDTSNKEFNGLNVPTHDRKHQVKSKELIGLAADLIKEFTSALSNLHTYTEQRIKTFYVESTQEQLSAQTQKFCSYLHGNATVLRAVEHSFSSFYRELKTDSLITLETVSGFQGFADAFHHYIMYLEKLIPYILLSTDEECKSSTCSQTLEEHNRQVAMATVGMVRIFTKVDSYIQALSSAGSSGAGLLPSNYNVCFMQLTCFLEELHESIKELSKHYHSKITLEHQLPTTTQTLKTTDDCIVSTLVFLITVTGKIVKFMNNNLDFLSSKSVLRTRGASTAAETDLTTSPAVVSFRHQAADYITKVIKPSHDSVPYHLSLHNHNVLATSSQSRDALSEQIALNQEKMSKLEQDKEHWMLECQLLQVKHEKESKKVASLEKELVKLKSSASADQTANSTQMSVPSSPTWLESPVEPTDLGKVLKEGTTEQSSDGMTRELLIKNHFTNRISDLTSQLQVMDSKTVSFAAECRSLYKRIRQSEKDRDGLAQKLNTANAKVKQIEDELDVTKRNYETQLSMMSEHLCGMNEKLTTQQDEIESLKSGGKNRKGKK